MVDSIREMEHEIKAFEKECLINAIKENYAKTDNGYEVTLNEEVIIGVSLDSSFDFVVNKVLLQKDNVYLIGQEKEVIGEIKLDCECAYAGQLSYVINAI